jgi:hypothetical protein
MQHFCEALKPDPHRAIYREMAAKYPEINPWPVPAIENASRQLQLERHPDPKGRVRAKWEPVFGKDHAQTTG